MTSLLLLTLIAASYCHATPRVDELTAVLSNARLPRPLELVTTYYDGADSIYLFGGYTGSMFGLSSDILVYSVSTDEVTKVGSLPQGSSAGVVESDLGGNYFYLGGTSGVSARHLFKYSRDSNTTETLPPPPYTPWQIGSVKYAEDSNLIYIFGPFYDPSAIYSFDMSNAQSVYEGRMPVDIFSTSAVRVGSTAFLFGRHDNNTFVMVDLDTLQTRFGPSDFNQLGSMYVSSAVGDSDGLIYVIAGHYQIPGPQVIYEVNTETEQHREIPIINFPLNATDYYVYSPRAVHVKSLDRIYLFGGRSQEKIRDEIWYLDLQPSVTEPPPLPRLTAELSEVKLPRSAKYMGIYYDGDDSIYLLGGWVYGVGTVGDILLYSIENDSISQIGSLPNVSEGGSVQGDEDGGIIYVGGAGYVPDARYVFKYDPASNTTDTLAPPPYRPTNAATVLEQGSVLVFAPTSNRSAIYSFDLETHEHRHVGSLPHDIQFPTAARVDQLAYLFGVSAHSTFLKVNLATLETEEEVGFHNFTWYSQAIVDSKQNIYILGGYWNEGECEEGIFRLNTETDQSVIVPIRNFPPTTSCYQTAPDAVYVEKLDRIYFFGGNLVRSAFPTDVIWYVDLSVTPTVTPTVSPSTTAPPNTTPTPSTTLPPTTTMSPTTTTQPTTTMTTSTQEITSTGFTPSTTHNPEIVTCANRTDGTYPHPYDCSMYITCTAGDLEVFFCPTPQLFNPISSKCDDPDNVNCDITCAGRPDGYYPHPHDCSLFIGCSGGHLEILQCPPPTLFDPDLIVCNYPEFVNCPIK